MENLRYLPGVSTLTINKEACVGCGMCKTVCPHGVITVKEKVELVDFDGCMECGACVKNCPTEAIQVHPGVGCAAYIIQTWIKGKNAAACGGIECCG